MSTGTTLTDSFHRRIRYLRISVTDRCNLRCTYCMPEQGLEWKDRHELLSYEEWARIVKAVVPLGIEKIRVTGGEPLVRNNIVDFLRMLCAIDGLKDVTLTTNGVLLDSMADDIRKAGVKRINISLDTFRPDTFMKISKRADHHRVMNGIRAAREAGFDPIKINCVVLPGVNDDEVLDFVNWTTREPVIVRFIENMPLSDQYEGVETLGTTIPSMDLVNRIRLEYPFEQTPEAGSKGNNLLFQVPGAPGRVEFISAVSHSFCEHCDRLRLTAEGQLRWCLFDNAECDLRAIVRNPAKSDADIVRVFQRITLEKPEAHLIGQYDQAPSNRYMSAIGG